MVGKSLDSRLLFGHALDTIMLTNVFTCSEWKAETKAMRVAR
jgi:hypothetical protein